MASTKLLKRSLIAGTVVAFSLSISAFAGGNPAVERQAMMKNVGAATGAAAGMIKGKIPFNAVAAQLALRTMNNAALGFGALFPEGSESGAETEASPKIWSDRAGFDKAIADFSADTASAETIKDLDSLKAAFGIATENCGSCHKAYRIKKN
ncbi:MAG: cytochrome c [Rhizobiaceae bacterium]